MPTLESFDKKLGEADAYLQLLIEQTKVCKLTIQISSFVNNNILRVLVIVVVVIFPEFGSKNEFNVRGRQSTL